MHADRKVGAPLVRVRARAFPPDGRKGSGGGRLGLPGGWLLGPATCTTASGGQALVFSAMAVLPEQECDRSTGHRGLVMPMTSRAVRSPPSATMLPPKRSIVKR